MWKSLSIQSVRLMVAWLSCPRERGHWSVNPHSPQLYFSKQFTKLTLWLLFITFFELGSCQLTPQERWGPFHSAHRITSGAEP